MKKALSSLEKWELSTTELVENFVNKYFDKDTDWYAVSDEIEGVICVNDYFWNLEDIVSCVRYNPSRKKLFQYYDYAIECGNKDEHPSVSFRNFVKFKMPLTDKIKTNKGR